MNQPFHKQACFHTTWHVIHERLSEASTLNYIKLLCPTTKDVWHLHLLGMEGKHMEIEKDKGVGGMRETEDTMNSSLI